MRYVVALVLLLAAGCYQYKPITRGTVIKHHHTPQHEELLFVNYFGDIGIPITETVPERWSLLIQDGERKQWFTVDQKTFDTLKDGDEWSKDAKPTPDTQKQRTEE